MRDPSIHIKESDLKKILSKHLEHGYKDLAKIITKEAKQYSCEQRVVQVSTQYLEKKTKKILTSSKMDANLVSEIIHKIRLKNKHRGVKRIQEDSKEWGQVKELAKVCNQFSEEFDLEKREGYIKYIKYGMKKISSTRQIVTKLINMQESISQEFEFIHDISEDENPRETREIHDLYVDLIFKKTGLHEPLIDKPQKYVNFIKVRKLTDELDLPYDLYIESQFQGLEWTDNYPEPTQLVSEKARERLNKYLYKNKVKLNKKEKESTTDNYINFLKNLRDGN